MFVLKMTFIFVKCTNVMHVTYDNYLVHKTKL